MERLGTMSKSNGVYSFSNSPRVVYLMGSTGERVFLRDLAGRAIDMHIQNKSLIYKGPISSSKYDADSGRYVEKRLEEVVAEAMGRGAIGIAIRRVPHPVNKGMDHKTYLSFNFADDVAITREREIRESEEPIYEPEEPLLV